MKKTLCATLIGLYAAVFTFIPRAHAAMFVAGNILGLTVEGTNYATVQVEGNGFVSGSSPSCVTAAFANQGYFVMDVSTSKGKALLSVLLSAYLAGKSVGVTGTGTCSSNVPASGTTLEAVSKVTLGASGA